LVRIVVPFAPGGSNDIVGRALAQQLTARTKRNFVVENKAGAGGSLGTEWVARAEPDGTNLLLISSTFTMNPSIMKLRYDPVHSFVPVAMLGMGPSVIAVPAQSPWKTIRDLVEDSKRRPGQIVFGSAGTASFQHFGIEWFMQKTGARFTVAHYKGGVPALIDLAAGHIQVSLGSLIQMQSFLKAGKIRLLAVAGPKRVDQIPQVPTLHESGYALEVHNWWGLLAPAGTSPEWVQQLHADVNAVLSSPEMRQRLSSEGADVAPMSRDEFTRMISEDMQRWGQVALTTGIKTE
jgi:tripartite-type tricarboxylate transporter receptor subunit TctC